MLEIVSVWLFEWLWILSDLIMKPRKMPYEKGFQREASCNKFDLQAYKDMEKKTVRIQSNYGYVLECEIVDGQEQPVKKLAILCHGFGCAKYDTIKYMELYLKHGFTVVMYDHRNHGHSGRAHTSMGFYEKYDLCKVIDWCLKNYGNDCSIITHGESMGAATVLLHLGIDTRVTCAISDCAYSDLITLLRHQLHEYYHLPCFLIPFVSGMTYLRAGFYFREVSPINVICQVETPVLFIHGKRDNLVPAAMSRQMYECKKKNKGIYLVAKAKHSESYCTNKVGYEKRVMNFIKYYMEQEKK